MQAIDDLVILVVLNTKGMFVGFTIVYTSSQAFNIKPCK